MITLITGGSASGKSEYAEELACKMHRQQKDAPFYYVATMQPFDEESKAKIKRHQKMRKEKGFTTKECFLGLKKLELEKDSILLLDCMSNLVANERFDSYGAGENTFYEVMKGIHHIDSICSQIVIVTNEVFSDGGNYQKETVNYMRDLGKINCEIAKISEHVVEVVYGIPVMIK